VKIAISLIESGEGEWKGQACDIACYQQLWITDNGGSTLVGVRTAKLAIFAVLSTTTVFACTCVSSSSEPSLSICQMAKAKAVTVFVGKVEHIGPKTVSLPPDNAPCPAQVITFRVVESFGTRQSATVVVTDWQPGNGSCGFPFAEGHTYLVDSSFWREGNSLHLNSCGMTAEASEAQKLLRELRICGSKGVQTPASNKKQ
jgi:hypothetical protein